MDVGSSPVADSVIGGVDGTVVGVVVLSLTDSVAGPTVATGEGAPCSLVAVTAEGVVFSLVAVTCGFCPGGGTVIIFPTGAVDSSASDGAR